MKTINKVNTVEKVDLSNYTLKQKQSLQKGYDIWCSGCLSGDWEDEGFRNEYSNNSWYRWRCCRWSHKWV